jgi:hypothetical protein
MHFYYLGDLPFSLRELCSDFSLSLYFEALKVKDTGVPNRYVLLLTS